MFTQDFIEEVLDEIIVTDADILAVRKSLVRGAALRVSALGAEPIRVEVDIILKVAAEVRDVFVFSEVGIVPDHQDLWLEHWMEDWLRKLKHRGLRSSLRENVIRNPVVLMTSPRSFQHGGHAVGVLKQSLRNLIEETVADSVHVEDLSPPR